MKKAQYPGSRDAEVFWSHLSFLISQGNFCKKFKMPRYSHFVLRDFSTSFVYTIPIWQTDRKVKNSEIKVFEIMKARFTRLITQIRISHHILILSLPFNNISILTIFRLSSSQIHSACVNFEQLFRLGYYEVPSIKNANLSYI